MTDTDERPLLTKGPEWAQDIVQDFSDRLDTVLEPLWHVASEAAAAAVERGERNAAEGQNDALSIFGQVLSYGLVCLAEHIGMNKDVRPGVAMAVALADLNLRARLAFADAAEGTDQAGMLEEATRNMAANAAQCPKVRVLREWLLSQADMGNAVKWGERVPNEVNEQLNAAAHPGHPEALHMASQLVARALIARGILNVAADWWASTPNQPDRTTCLGALKSIVDELPADLQGGSYIPEEVVN